MVNVLLGTDTGAPQEIPPSVLFATRSDFGLKVRRSTYTEPSGPTPMSCNSSSEPETSIKACGSPPVALCAADWTTENVLPARETLSERGDSCGFAVHATVAIPGPVPLAGETVSHALASFEFQFPPSHPLGEPTIATERDPANELGETEVGFIEKLAHVGGAVPDCTTENVRFAIVTAPVRADWEGLTAHNTVAVPAPLPLEGPTESHEAFELVLHPPPLQPAGDEPMTAMLLDDEPADGLAAVGSITNDVQAAGVNAAVLKVIAFANGAHPAPFLTHARNWYRVSGIRPVAA